MTPKEWLKSQIGVWQFYYEGRDIRDKTLHPATFPISLAKKIIELFTHQGELVLDPFVGSGTTLVAANDLNRNCVGFDLQSSYIELCGKRLSENGSMFNEAKQIAIQDDARNISDYFDKDSISLIWTSPPYANLLNRKRQNKSRRDRKNEQLGKVEQYSQDKCDLGTLFLDDYTKAMGDIYEQLLPLLRPKGHCVINVPDMWWENQRITIHVSLIEELRKRGYELRNIIIWDRTNIVNGIGIFGWPSNYITMGVTLNTYWISGGRPANSQNFLVDLIRSKYFGFGNAYMRPTVVWGHIGTNYFINAEVYNNYVRTDQSRKRFQFFNQVCFCKVNIFHLWMPSRPEFGQTPIKSR
jgi:DNA modification methylase